MDLCWRAARKSKLERILNDRIREIMGTSYAITDNKRTKQLIWCEHVQRMGDERIQKQVLQWKSSGSISNLIAIQFDRYPVPQAQLDRQSYRLLL